MVTGATSNRQKGFSSPPVRASSTPSWKMSKPRWIAVWRPSGRLASRRRTRAMAPTFTAALMAITIRQGHSGRGKCNTWCAVRIAAL